MAFVQKALPRGRRSSDADSIGGMRPPTPDPPAEGAPDPAAQEAPAYEALVRMAITPDGSQLFSLPDSVHSPLLVSDASLLPPESDAELDLLALPPSSTHASIASPTLNPLGAEDAYSSVSEIFSPSGLSASEQDEQDPGVSDSEVIVDGFAVYGEGSGATGTDYAGTGTGGWARWAAARVAWAEAQAAAAQARRPSTVSLASSVSDHDRQHRSRAQRLPDWDVPVATPRGGNSMTTSWSWTNIYEPAAVPAVESSAPPPMPPVTAPTFMSDSSARGLVLLDELDMFDDEMQATRRGTPVSSAVLAAPTEAWTHTGTIDGLSGLLPPREERSGAATPRRVRSAAPSRTPSLLHLLHNQASARAVAPSPARTRTQAIETDAPEGVDSLLATAPGAESAGLHKPQRRGMKRVRSPRTRQGSEHASDVWSRLNGDYGRFIPAAAYSSDSDGSVEAVRSSKRSTASVSTTRRQQLVLRQREARGVSRGRSRSASDWSTRPVASVGSGRAREPSSRTDAPAPPPARQEGLVSALWRKVFAVDQDVLDAFMAAEADAPSASHTSYDATPLGISRQPPLMFGFGDNDPDSREDVRAWQTQEEAMYIQRPPSPPATPIHMPSSSTLPSAEEETLRREQAKMDEYLFPLPLLGQLESLAAAVRGSRAPPPTPPHMVPRRTRSLPYGRAALDPAPLEPTTGEALQALLGSMGAQLQSQVGRHLFFLSFARGWFARARGASPTRSASLPDDGTSPAAAFASKGLNLGAGQKSADPMGPRSLSISSAGTIARYQLGE